MPPGCRRSSLLLGFDNRQGGVAKGLQGLAPILYVVLADYRGRNVHRIPWRTRQRRDNAFDLTSGESKWKWTGEGPAYGSPVLLTVDGSKQLVTLTEKSLVG